VYTAREIADCRGADGSAAPAIFAARLAARFAAKEATLKVLRPGPGVAIDPRAIEVVRGEGGAPEIVLHGAAARAARAAGIAGMSVSLSHEGDIATAVVVADRDRVEYAAMNDARRIELGPVPIDAVTREAALDRVEQLVRSRAGGAVFTPNVDHVVLAHEQERFRDAYARASLSLVDGMPLLWTARLFGTPLPEKVSGSDFVQPLLERAADRGWRVYFLGGAPGVGELARERVLERLPALRVVGVDAPRIDLDETPEAREPVLARIRASKAEIVLVALGAPKQEIWIDEVRSALAPAVLLGVGASLDFLAGTLPRAPRWMSEAGLEWLYRLGREPRRLWRRYLVRDPKFLVVAARAWRARRARAS
jgi:N-acetylglucosaminyldiphosphoundecaprenol N-acetyl-beta-D-mannosaminyltransferase